MRTEANYCEFSHNRRAKHLRALLPICKYTVSITDSVIRLTLYEKMYPGYTQGIPNNVPIADKRYIELDVTQ